MRTSMRPVMGAGAAVLGLVLVVASALLLVSHLREPSAFPGAGGWSVSDRTIAVGRATYIGMTYENAGAHGTIAIRSARANVTSNSGDARTVLYVCHIRPDADYGAVGTEFWPTEHRQCASLEPADGARLRLNNHPDQQVVLGVTLTEPGSVSIKGIDIDYSQGWHHGTQRTGGDIHLQTPN